MALASRGRLEIFLDKNGQSYMLDQITDVLEKKRPRTAAAFDKRVAELSDKKGAFGPSYGPDSVLTMRRSFEDRKGWTDSHDRARTRALASEPTRAMDNALEEGAEIAGKAIKGYLKGGSQGAAKAAAKEMIGEAEELIVEAGELKNLGQLAQGAKIRGLRAEVEAKLKEIEFKDENKLSITQSESKVIEFEIVIWVE